ncbi:MAG: PD-(D/E)XK nuclease family protein [Deltaproteobacteria bacterium]|nr:PD-(D/E)XK nuclease family protein [Deltaproteobacteria bacterium]
MSIKLVTDFDQFRDALNELRREALASERSSSPRFSFFEVLGLQRAEKFHSRFLASLLDPAGTHAQGSLFLERFLDHCIERHHGFACFRNQLARQGLDRWHVRTEESLETGRADIWLEFPPGSEPEVTIIIENKIDALEGERQLERYGDVVYRRPLGALVYLTPAGAESETCGRYIDRYTRLSYSADVVTWLTDCIAAIESPRVRETVRQYMDSVRNLDKEGEKLMPGDEQIQEYFKRPENGEAVLDIGRYAEKISADLQKQFLTQLGQDLDNRLKGWRASPKDGKQNLSNLKWDWFPDPRPTDAKYLRPRVGHDPSGLFVGVYVGLESEKEDTRQRIRNLVAGCPEVATLRSRLVETWPEQSGQWDTQGRYGSLAFKRLNFNLREPRDLARFGSNKQMVVKKFIKEIAQLFESIRPVLKTANDCIEKLNDAP